MFIAVWKSPFSVDEELTNISAEAVPSPSIKDDLNSYIKGEEACNRLISGWISEDGSVDFFAHFPCVKLKTFTSMNHKTIHLRDKDINLTTDQDTFEKCLSLHKSKSWT